MIFSAVCRIVLPNAHHPWNGLGGNFITIIMTIMIIMIMMITMIMMIIMIIFTTIVMIMIIIYQVGFMSAVTTTICDSFPDVEKKLIAKVLNLKFDVNL